MLTARRSRSPTSRCPRCRYKLAHLDESCVCPECGLDEDGRQKLWESRNRRRESWLLAYWIIAVVAALPIVPMLANTAAGMVYLRLRPASPGWHAESGEFPLLDVTATFSLLGVLASLLFWPFLVLISAYIVYSNRATSQRDQLTPLVWLLMAAALATPLVLIVFATQMVFPDSFP